MIRSTTFPMRALIAGIGLVALACSDAPTNSPAELGGPQLAKKERPNFGPAIEIQFDDGTGNNIRSDGRGIYVDRECGVSATFNLEDARLDPDADKISPKKVASCGGTRDERFVTVEYTERLGGTTGRPELDGTVRQGNFFIVQSVETVMQSDTPVLRSATIHGVGCGLGLRFNGDAPSNLLEVRNVTGTADGPWTIATQPPTTEAERRDVAVCITSGRNPPPLTYWHMPFSMTVTLK